jgi:xanthine dehydrogenase YagT iron-sulfur-binding subunit
LSKRRERTINREVYMSATTPDAAQPAFARHPLRITLNRQRRELEVLPWTTLLDLLREQLDLIGTK